jgi:hypothetical protein
LYIAIGFTLENFEIINDDDAQQEYDEAIKDDIGISRLDHYAGWI